MPPRKSSVAMRRLRPPAQRHTDSSLPWAAPADRPADRGVDLSRIEHAIREIIIALGEDPDREGLRQTPARIARGLCGAHSRPAHRSTCLPEDIVRVRLRGHSTPAGYHAARSGAQLR